MADDQPANQETILVVEDDVLVRMPIAQYLRDCGYKVIEAANADEATTVAKTFPISFWQSASGRAAGDDSTLSRPDLQMGRSPAARS